MDHTGEAVRRADAVRTGRTMTDGGRTGDGRMNGGEEHVCEACGKTFPTEAELEDHMHEQGIVD